MEQIYNFFQQIYGNETIMEILKTIAFMIVSTGIIAIFIKHQYEKKTKKLEIKLKKYIALGEELSKLTANIPNHDKLNPLLNSVYFFSSENVVKKVSEFNKLYTDKRNEAENNGSPTLQITSEDLKPLIVAIRKELDLDSDYIENEKINFFMKQ